MKASVYTAWFPLAHERLDFSEADIEFAEDVRSFAWRFSSPALTVTAAAVPNT